jgi:hypothetical protein
LNKFYFGMNYNGEPMGITIAKKLIPELVALTGHSCTSRWPWSEAHEQKEFRLTIAVTDALDIARADYVILGPLTGTSRGVHVEQGIALGLDKPVYLYRPDKFDGTGFDAICLPWKENWKNALFRILADEEAKAKAAG